MANAVVLWVIVYFCVTSVNTKDCCCDFNGLLYVSLGSRISPIIFGLGSVYYIIGL